jgi:hypothetical protein
MENNQSSLKISVEDLRDAIKKEYSNGEMYAKRAPAKNKSTSCLSFGPSTALHPPTRISICAAGCAL